MQILYIVGTHGAAQACQNKKSPFYDPSAQDLIGTFLTYAQHIEGCEKIVFNGKQISPATFEQVPIDSKLRTLSLQDIVAGYNPDMDLI